MKQRNRGGEDCERTRGDCEVEHQRNLIRHRCPTTRQPSGSRSSPPWFAGDRSLAARGEYPLNPTPGSRAVDQRGYPLRSPARTTPTEGSISPPAGRRAHGTPARRGEREKERPLSTLRSDPRARREQEEEDDEAACGAGRQDAARHTGRSCRAPPTRTRRPPGARRAGYVPPVTRAATGRAVGSRVIPTRQTRRARTPATPSPTTPPTERDPPTIRPPHPPYSPPGPKPLGGAGGRGPRATFTCDQLPVWMAVLRMSTYWFISWESLGDAP